MKTLCQPKVLLHHQQNLKNWSFYVDSFAACLKLLWTVTLLTFLNTKLKKGINFTISINDKMVYIRLIVVRVSRVATLILPKQKEKMNHLNYALEIVLYLFPKKFWKKENAIICILI